MWYLLLGRCLIPPRRPLSEKPALYSCPQVQVKGNGSDAFAMLILEPMLSTIKLHAKNGWALLGDVVEGQPLQLILDLVPNSRVATAPTAPQPCASPATSTSDGGVGEEEEESEEEGTPPSQPPPESAFKEGIDDGGPSSRRLRGATGAARTEVRVEQYMGGDEGMSTASPKL